MKRFIINLGAVLAAFLIGLAIEDACAKIEDKKENETPKGSAQFAILKNVDGLLIGSDGKVYNKLSSSSIQNNDVFELGNFYGVNACTEKMTYDDFGRLQTRHIEYSYFQNFDNPSVPATITFSYSYSGLTVTETVSGTGLSNPPAETNTYIYLPAED